MLRSRRRRSPNPGGTGAAGVGGFDEILDLVASGGVAAIPAGPIAEYVQAVARVDPDTLSRDGALAYRLNLYNAGALAPARRAFDATEQTVLRMPGGFSEPFVEVAGRGEAATHRQQTRSRCGLPLVRRVASGRATSSSRRPSPRRYGAPPGRCTPAPCRTRCSDARLRRPLRPQTRIR